MDWKNQLTKTPILVLFVILISVGVGTASALITITLAGDVIITGDTQVDGDISIGTSDNLDDGFLFFDGGAESLKWEDFSDSFFLSDDLFITGATTLQGDLTCSNCVDSSDLGLGAVGSLNINNDAVQGVHIRENAVDSSQIAADAVGAGEIATDAVRADEIQAGAVGSSEILDGSITTTDISTSFMKFVRFIDDSTGNAAGWNPNGATTEFTITDSDIIHTGSKMSVVAISLHDNSASPVCSVKTIGGGEFRVKCTIAPAEGSILGYVLMTPP